MQIHGKLIIPNSNHGLLVLVPLILVYVHVVRTMKAMKKDIPAVVVLAVVVVFSYESKKICTKY